MERLLAPFKVAFIVIYFEPAEGTRGAVVVDGKGSSAFTSAVVRRRLTMLKSRKQTRNATTKNITVRGDTPRARDAVPGNGNAAPPVAGKSPTNRVAMPSASDCVHRPFGSPAIIDVNRRVAAADDNRPSRAASCQGSMPSRAKAESTVRTVSFLSVPIGAYRKSLNSDFSSENAGGNLVSGPRIRHVYAR